VEGLFVAVSMLLAVFSEPADYELQEVRRMQSMISGGISRGLATFDFGRCLKKHVVTNRRGPQRYGHERF
jgi:hypothetical protein